MIYKVLQRIENKRKARMDESFTIQATVSGSIKNETATAVSKKV